MNAPRSKSFRPPRVVANGRLRPGFTLLEMLLAAILSATLMLSLWGLFGTYMRLFETGQTKAERSQLVRGLGQQLADDLLATLPPPTPPGANRAVWPPNATPAPGASTSLGLAAVDNPPPLVQTDSPVDNAFPANSGGSPDRSLPSDNGPAPLNRLAADSGVVSNNSFSARGASESLRTAGLVGTSRALQLDLLQVASDPSMLPRPAASDSTGRRPRPLVAPELRSVLYTFESPREVRATDRRPPPGLVRREMDWQTLWQEMAGVRRSNAQTAGSSAERAIAQAIEAFRLNAPDAFERQVDEATTWVPEIVALQFHYFDGRQWLTEWDSRARRSLPAAVEVAMQIRDATKKPAADHVSAVVVPSGSPATKGIPRSDVSDNTFSEPGTILYRDVVVLRQSGRLPAQADPRAEDRFRQRPGTPLGRTSGRSDGWNPNGGRTP